jgi:hypothetical protein
LECQRHAASGQPDPRVPSTLEVTFFEFSAQFDPDGLVHADTRGALRVTGGQQLFHPAFLKRAHVGKHDRAAHARRLRKLAGGESVLRHQPDALQPFAAALVVLATPGALQFRHAFGAQSGAGSHCGVEVDGEYRPAKYRFIPIPNKIYSFGWIAAVLPISFSFLFIFLFLLVSNQ